jgi:hypothetical protein
MAASAKGKNAKAPSSSLGGGSEAKDGFEAKETLKIAIEERWD